MDELFIFLGKSTVFYDLWKDGYEAGIDRAMAQFSVAVSKKLIGFCPESGVTSVVEALDYVLKNCFDEVVEFEKQMRETETRLSNQQHDSL